MKSTAFILSSFLIIGISAARADLDLTPSQKIHTMERVPIAQVVFHDGAKEITYQAPRGWVCTGSHDSAALSIPNHPAARAYIRSAATVRLAAFDDKSEKLLLASPALYQLPRGAKDVKLTEVDLNPLVVDGHPTLEFQVTYSFFGQSCQRSTLLVNRNGAEVSFVLDSLAADFQPLHSLFRGSIFSMENL